MSCMQYKVIVTTGPVDQVSLYMLYVYKYDLSDLVLVPHVMLKTTVSW